MKVATPLLPACPCGLDTHSPVQLTIVIDYLLESRKLEQCKGIALAHVRANKLKVSIVSWNEIVLKDTSKLGTAWQV
jgi:hypothetical protein